MGSPYLCEVRIFSFNFPPRGWAFCNGQTLPVQQNQAAYSLLGTTYGGNGTTNFCLPNLQGRMAYHQGQQNGDVMVIGENGGETTHTLLVTEIPTHVHIATASTVVADASTPDGAFVATQASNTYGPAATSVMNLAAVGTTGGSQPHQNQQPYLVLNFCIALSGIYPSRN